MGIPTDKMVWGGDDPFAQSYPSPNFSSLGQGRDAGDGGSVLDIRLTAIAPNLRKTTPAGLLGDEVAPPQWRASSHRGRTGGGQQLPRLRRGGGQEPARGPRRQAPGHSVDEPAFTSYDCCF